MTIIAVEYVDYGAQGEYGFFGKVKAKSIVAGMTPDEIAAEVAEMVAIHGGDVTPVYVEQV